MPTAEYSKSWMRKRHTLTVEEMLEFADREAARKRKVRRLELALITGVILILALMAIGLQLALHALAK